VFVRMARSRPTVAVSEDVPEKELREPPEFQGHYDPHLWFDVKLWTAAITRTQRALMELDASGAEVFAKNAEDYRKELLELDAWVRAEMAKVPRQRRVLITSHDAFGYFGRAYEVDVVGLQGISTVTEAGLNDITRLVDLIVSRKIKAVFVETSVSEKNLRSVVAGAKERGHDVKIGGTLFSDSMGAEGTPEGTYVGMIKHNVTTIVNALR